MPRLVTVAQVLARMNFAETLPDIPEVLGDILDSLKPDIEQDLRTNLSETVVTDRWFVQKSLSPAAGVYQTFLAGSRSFIQSLTSIRCAPSYARLATDYDDLSDYAVVEGDGERGSLAVFDVCLDSKYVQAVYVAGLPELTDDTFGSVPEWMQELAIWRAILKFDALHPGTRLTEGGEKSTEQIADLANGIVNRHIRYLPVHLPVL